jgi:hypothetical protein
MLISSLSVNKHGELPVVAMFVNGSGRMSNLYREPSIDASHKVLDHLAKQVPRKRFLGIDQSETRIACGGQDCEWIGMK